MGRRTIVLVLAVVLAGLSAWAIWAFLSDVEEDARAGLDEVTVFRATEFIDRNAEGDAVIDKFAESTELEELLPDNAITTQAQLVDVLSGKVSRGPISKGQVVTTDLWAEPAEEVASLSELISPGRQAITIRPDEVRAVGGFVRAGDGVNVIATLDVDRSTTIAFLRNPVGRDLLGVADEFNRFERLLPADLTGEQVEEVFDELASAIPETKTVTLTVLQDVQVLAVGSVARGGPSGEDAGEAPEAVEALGSQLITLEVTPEEAEQVAWVFENSSVWLSLVSSQVPYEPVPTEGITIEDIVGEVLDRRAFDALGVESP